MEFFDTIIQVKTNWQPYKQWELEQQKKEKQNEELRKKYPPMQQELEHAKQYGRTIVDVINTMDQHSIDKSEDAMVVINSCMEVLSISSIVLGTGIGALLKKIPSIKNNNKLHQPFALIGFMLGAAVSSIIRNIWSAQIEKQASRIARYQTRENDLKDSRNFVVYDNEQIKKAEEVSKTLPEIKENRKDITLKQSLNPIKTFSNAMKTTKDLQKDYTKYEKWKNGYIQEEALKNGKFKTINTHQDKLEKAEKDRDVILGTIKQIENASLNYMMNMSLALNAINAALFSGGLALGGGIGWLLNHLQKKNILPEKSGILNSTKITLPVILPVFLMISVMGASAKAIKDSARVGRFKAKQDLLNNPEKFIVFPENIRKTATDIKESKLENKGFIERFKEDIKSLKQLKLDYAEYKIYMNTKHKEELKLDEALKQIKISPEQEIEAKYLQKNVFHSFEKMDEKAQRFTDDIDAAVDITRTIIATTVSTICRIVSLVFLNDKLMKHNDGKELKGLEMFKKLKYLKGSEIFIAVGTFILPSFVSMPVSIKGIQIKKDAGKIGVMTAMKDLDDPKNFLNELT